MNRSLIALASTKKLFASANNKRMIISAFNNKTVRPFHQTSMRRDEEEEYKPVEHPVKPAWMGVGKLFNHHVV